jgi:hypothetical protein
MEWSYTASPMTYEQGMSRKPFAHKVLEFGEGVRHLGKCMKCFGDIREPAKVVPGLGVVHPRCAPSGFVQCRLAVSVRED